MNVGPDKDGPGTFEHYKRARGAPWISTVSGKKFFYRDPLPDMVDIKDIATALSHICRFTGQIEDFYSVAEHSVLCSYIVPREFGLCALLHDATEAYVQDIASPLKRELPEYKVIEDRVWEWAIAPKFNLPIVLPEIVKIADQRLFSSERIELQPWTLNDPDYYAPWQGDPAHLNLSLWAPREARRQFIKRYEELTRSVI